MRRTNECHKNDLIPYYNKYCDESERLETVCEVFNDVINMYSMLEYFRKSKMYEKTTLHLG